MAKLVPQLLVTGVSPGCSHGSHPTWSSQQWREQQLTALLSHWIMNQWQTSLPFRAMSSLLLHGAQLIQPLSQPPNPTVTLCYAHVGNYWSSESLFPEYQGGKCHIQPFRIQEYICVSPPALHNCRWGAIAHPWILLTPFYLWISNSGEGLVGSYSRRASDFKVQWNITRKIKKKKKKSWCFHPSEQTKPAFSTLELNNLICPSFQLWDTDLTKQSVFTPYS